MKIGLVCPYDMFRPGGVQEHVLAQYKELKKRGYDVRILTPKPRHNHINPPEDMVFVGHSAMLKLPISTSLELGIANERNAIDELLQNENFDLLHIHEPEVPVIGAQIIAKADCPIVATFHALHPENAAGRTIEAFRIPYSRSIFSKLDKLTAVSEVAAIFAKNQSRQPVQIIPNGIDIKKYAGLNRRTEYPTILYVGRLERRKGVIYLLKAFEELTAKQPSVRLEIAGEGPQRDKLEDYVQTHRLNNVSFLGFISEKDKIAKLRSSWLFVSPALFGESFGIVLLEAMAAGTPVIAGDNPGYSSVMQERGRLSLVNPKDIHAFTRQLEVFLFDTEIRDSWLKWATDYVKQYDYKYIVDGYEKVYKSLAMK